MYRFVLKDLDTGRTVYDENVTGMIGSAAKANGRVQAFVADGCTLTAAAKMIYQIRRLFAVKEREVSWNLALQMAKVFEEEDRKQGVDLGRREAP